MQFLHCLILFFLSRSISMQLDKHSDSYFFKLSLKLCRWLITCNLGEYSPYLKKHFEYFYLFLMPPLFSLSTDLFFPYKWIEVICGSFCYIYKKLSHENPGTVWRMTWKKTHRDVYKPNYYLNFFFPCLNEFESHMLSVAEKIFP